MQTQIYPALAAKLAQLPPRVSVPQLAEFWQEKEHTLRKRIRCGVFPVTIRQDIGSDRYVLLNDLEKFLIDGQTQPQLSINAMPKKRRGRPTNRERDAALARQAALNTTTK